MNNLIYLGLDISLNSTGFCVMDSKLNLLKYGVFDCIRIVSDNKEFTYHLKINQQIISMDSLFEEYSISKVFIERFSFGSFKFSNSASVLGEVTGCIKQNIFHRNVPYKTLAPLSVKKFITGSGKAKKENVAASVLRLYPEIVITAYDITDSIAVCLMGISLEEKM